MFLFRNIKNVSKSVLFADNTSALITSNNLNELQTKLGCTLTYMSEWFTANGLKLNIGKTNKMDFKLNFFYQIVHFKCHTVRLM